MAARELAGAFDVTVLEAGPEFKPFEPGSLGESNGCARPGSFSIRG